jgi:hypothetical protein
MRSHSGHEYPLFDCQTFRRGQIERDRFRIFFHVQTAPSSKFQGTHVSFEWKS